MVILFSCIFNITGLGILENMLQAMHYLALKSSYFILHFKSSANMQVHFLIGTIHMTMGDPNITRQKGRLFCIKQNMFHSESVPLGTVHVLRNHI